MPTIKDILRKKRMEKLIPKMKQHANDTERQTAQGKQQRRTDPHVGPMTRIARQ